jgi:endoglucanase
MYLSSLLSPGEEWEEYICPFVTEVIDAIRGNGSDSIIIVGTPDNSTSVDAASDSPLDYSNIAYSARLLSGLDTDTQKEKLDAALDDEVCVFVTQWGLTNDLGGGGIHVSESLKWIEFFDENQISWCNYAIGSYSSSETNALNLNNDRYTDEQKTSGHWPAGMITESGSFIREEFLKTSEEPEPGETTETEATEETEQGED